MTRLEVEGELTVHTAAEQHARLVAFFEDAGTAGGAAGPLELDLSGVSELDTAGLQLLLAAVREAERLGAALVLADPSPDVLRVLELTRLTALLAPGEVH